MAAANVAGWKCSALAKIVVKEFDESPSGIKSFCLFNADKEFQNIESSIQPYLDGRGKAVEIHSSIQQRGMLMFDIQMYLILI